jgi:hypothetical protein
MGEGEDSGQIWEELQGMGICGQTETLQVEKNGTTAGQEDGK